MKNRLKMDLQLFSEEMGAESGVEEVSAAEGYESEVDTSESGANEVAAEPAKQNNFEKAFAKRLAEAQSKWEAEAQEKYRGHEDYKYLADYLQQTNGMDVLTLKEQIELERLHARADKEQVPPEFLRRIDELEAKAAEGEQIKQQVAEDQRVNQYHSALGEFAKSKGIEPDALNQFMIENQLAYDPNNMERSFTIAFKAMDYDGVTSKVESAQKDGMKKLIQAKGSIPTVHGSQTQGQVVSPPAKTWAEARARAMQR